MPVAIAERHPVNDPTIGPEVVVTSGEYELLVKLAPHIARELDGLGAEAVLPEFEDLNAQQEPPAPDSSNSVQRGSAAVGDMVSVEEVSPEMTKPNRLAGSTRRNSKRSYAKSRPKREDEDLVHLYLTDIGKYKLLTREDEVVLANTIRTGTAAQAKLDGELKLSPKDRRLARRQARAGEEARRKFTNANLRLVVSIAKKYQYSGLSLLDLVQEGSLGLIHAIEKFDPDKGFKFSTYATNWIRQALQRGIANTSRTIRLPVHAGEILTQALKARNRLEIEYGREVTLAELAKELEVSLNKITEVMHYAGDTLSLSEPVGENGDSDFGDILEDRKAESPSAKAVEAQLPGEIEKLLTHLDDRERTVIIYNFGLDGGGVRPQEKIGAYLGVSAGMINKIRKDALAKLLRISDKIDIRELLG